ncbi:hypothetical protein HDK64DRAFT_134644 [Phyllosticta capitalensis]
MPSTVVDHGDDDSRPSRLHVPALRQLYTRVSRRGRPKSTVTDSSLSSRPVVVRTYSPASRRSKASASSRSPSSAREPRHSACPSSSSSSSAMPTGGPPPSLPPTADFSFAGILHAVEPEISGAIDAIAAICARSKLCLADEYAAHRPPHEVLDPAIPIPLPGQSQRQRWWSVVRDTALAAVPEASSSSERLTGSRSASRASISSVAAQSAKGKKTSAYGSLKSFVSGDGAERRRGLASLFGGFGGGGGGGGDTPSHHLPSSSDFSHAQWMVPDDGNGCIRLSSGTTARAASPRVSLAVTEEPIAVNGASTYPAPSPSPSAATPANATTTSTTPARLQSSAPSPVAPPRSRSRALSSPSWLSWSSNSPRANNHAPSHSHPLSAGATVAEQRLKWLLEASALSKARAKQCDYRLMPA